MLTSILPSTLAGQVTLLLCVAAFVLLGALYRQLLEQNRRLSTVLNNMSQGLNMFDAQGRITLLNTRYLEMYKLDPTIVKPGCTIKKLIEYRKATGLFAGDVDSYVQKILDGIAQGKSQQHYVEASDGRIVLAKNEPLPGGGWVSTHEDVTEQRRAEQEGAAIRDQEHRRAIIDSSIASFRPVVEKTSVEREQQCNRDALDRTRVVRLIRAHLAKGGERGAGLQRSVGQRGDRSRCSR